MAAKSIVLVANMEEDYYLHEEGQRYHKQSEHLHREHECGIVENAQLTTNSAIELMEILVSPMSDISTRMQAADMLRQYMRSEIALMLINSGILEHVDQMKTPEIYTALKVLAKISEHKAVVRHIWGYFPVARLWNLFNACESANVRMAIVSIMYRYTKLAGFMANTAEVQTLVVRAAEAALQFPHEYHAYRIISILHSIGKQLSNDSTVFESFRASQVEMICNANLRTQKVLLVVETCRLQRLLLRKSIISCDDIDWAMVFVLVKAQDSKVQMAVIELIEEFVEIQIGGDGIAPDVSKGLCELLIAVVEHGFSKAKEPAVRCISYLMQDNTELVSTVKMVESLCDMISIPWIKDSTTLAILRVLEGVIMYLTRHQCPHLSDVEQIVATCLTANEIPLGDEVISFHFQNLSSFLCL